MSITRYLCRLLPSPVYNVKPVFHDRSYANEITINGLRHATMTEARDYFKNINIELSDFKEIVAVIRHPYQMEISLWNHCKREVEKGEANLEWDRDQLVAEDNFKAFIRGNYFHKYKTSFKDFLHLDGELPANLRIIKFENTRKEMRRIKLLYSYRFWIRYTHDNRSPKHKTLQDLDKEDKEIIAKKYQWVFEQGYYQK